MKIISHRGWWRAEIEKNTPRAFQRTLSAGFGTETDVRDFAVSALGEADRVCRTADVHTGIGSVRAVLAATADRTRG